MELAHSAESRTPCPNCRRVEEHSILACAEEYRRLVRLKDPEMLEKRRKALAKALGIDGSRAVERDDFAGGAVG